MGGDAAMEEGGMDTRAAACSSAHNAWPPV